jgi:hypothetical protein
MGSGFAVSAAPVITRLNRPGTRVLLGVGNARHCFHHALWALRLHLLTVLATFGWCGRVISRARGVLAAVRDVSADKRVGLSGGRWRVQVAQQSGLGRHAAQLGCLARKQHTAFLESLDMPSSCERVHHPGQDRRPRLGFVSDFICRGRLCAPPGCRPSLRTVWLLGAGLLAVHAHIHTHVGHSQAWALCRGYASCLGGAAQASHSLACVGSPEHGSQEHTEATYVLLRAHTYICLVATNITRLSV